jgi:hypothetical protein
MESNRPHRDLASIRATRKWTAKVPPGTPASQWPSLAGLALQAGLVRQTETPEAEEMDVEVDVPCAPEPSVIVEPQPVAAARGPGLFGTVRMKARPQRPTVKIRRRWDPLSDVRVRLAIGAGVLTLGITLMWLLLARS